MTQKYERHGMTGTRILNIYRGMINRCTKHYSTSYPEYGGRGISVCQRWLTSFSNFYEDMGNPPSPKHTLERVNNNGNYEHSNCTWAIPKIQARNTRRNNYLTHQGQTLTVAEWAERLKMRQNTIYQRCHAGLTVEEILNPERRDFNKGHKGVANINAKMTPESALAAYQSTENLSVLAHRYNVTRAAISCIKKGLSWGHVTHHKSQT